MHLTRPIIYSHHRQYIIIINNMQCITLLPWDVRAGREIISFGRAPDGAATARLFRKYQFPGETLLFSLGRARYTSLGIYRAWYKHVMCIIIYTIPVAFYAAAVGRRVVAASRARPRGRHIYAWPTRYRGHILEPVSGRGPRLVVAPSIAIATSGCIDFRNVYDNIIPSETRRAGTRVQRLLQRIFYYYGYIYIIIIYIDRYSAQWVCV